MTILSIINFKISFNVQAYAKFARGICTNLHEKQFGKCNCV